MSREQLDSHGAPGSPAAPGGTGDVIALDEPWTGDDLDARRSSTDRARDAVGQVARRWRTVLGVGLAFALGVAVGVAGFGSWQGWRTELAEQDRVDVAASVDAGGVNMGPGSNLHIPVEIANQGSLPVEVVRLFLTGQGWQAEKVVPAGSQSIAPGASRRMFLPARVDCSAGHSMGSGQRPELALTVVPVSGRPRETALDITEDSDLSGILQTRCWEQMVIGVDGSYAGELRDEAGWVRFRLELRRTDSQLDRTATLHRLRPYWATTVTTDPPLPVVLDGEQPTTVEVRLRLPSCEELGFGTYLDPSMEVDARYDADAIPGYGAMSGFSLPLPFQRDLLEAVERACPDL